MEVTEIKKNAVSKALREIYIDGEYAFPLYENNIRALKIKEGSIIDEMFYQEKLFPLISKNALMDGLSYIARVNCTTGQVKEKLKKRKYPDAAIEQVMAYIEEKGFIDDYEYALSFAKISVKKGKGEKYISFELLKRGISDETVNEVISLTRDESKLFSVAEKKLSAILKGKEKPDYKELNKLKEYLMRQGYGYEEISEAVSRLMIEYED